MKIEQRIGPKNFKSVNPEALTKLNLGEISSVNLVEWLAVDSKELLKNFLSSVNREQYIDPIINALNSLKTSNLNRRNETIGSELLSIIQKNNDVDLIKIMQNHASDTIRCWACYIIGKNNKLKVEEVFENIEPLAADPHWGVREVAWMATRPTIIINLYESIEILKDWVVHENSNIRRYATEATRPRGVWCSHINKLKEEPEIAIPLLEAVRSDSEKYVRDSVGNWLNDASKTRPEYVIAICERWQKESNTKETAYIIKKALRTINKK